MRAKSWYRLLMLLLLAGLVITFARGGADEAPADSADPGPGDASVVGEAPGESPSEEAGNGGSVHEIALTVHGDELYFSFAAWRELVEPLGWSADWSDVDRMLTMRRGNEHYVAAVYGVPVIQRNGEFYPLPEPIVLSGDGEPLVGLRLLETLFGAEAVVAVGLLEGGGDGSVAVQVDAAALAAAVETWPRWERVEPDRAALVERLKFLEHPLAGAGVNIADSHVVGAPREYRYGVHEGFDFYDYRIGIPITLQTPVRSMADGVILRIDHDWVTPTPAERDAWLNASRQAGRTPEWLLDLFRGRQVWVQYDNGVMARYAHLSSVRSDLQVGDRVTTGEVLGTVGSSGTSGEWSGTGLHLHLDILVDGQVPWGAFSPAEQRAILGEIFGR